jgi:hypothetical protein
MAVSCHCY